ncbi:hypothetical protein TcBrA4_0048080 [Trypanosoma cruzi]|nr:hypothetical protein TcBrA4_0048080 [Trypanosoma cruzi]
MIIFLRVPLFVGNLRFCRRRGVYNGIPHWYLSLGMGYTAVTRLWWLGAYTLSRDWRRALGRTSRCDAWRTCRKQQGTDHEFATAHVIHGEDDYWSVVFS